MGGGIGWWFITNNQKVRLKDVSWDMIRKGYQSAYKIIKKGVKNKKVKPHEASLYMDKVSGGLDYSGFESMDMVIEAVPENLELKKTVFKDIESTVSKDTIIASNTSSLSIDEMASVLEFPKDF